MTHPLQVLIDAQKILVFFAHPDDEILIIPGLVDLCPGRDVKIVYATEGKTGDCFRGLCATAPIEQVRDAELRGSAALYGFNAVQAGLPSVGHLAPMHQDRVWDDNSGGSIRKLIENEVRAFKPDAIITFDPRHGTTGMPGGDPSGEHLLLGRLVLQALACTYPRDRIVMLASVLDITPTYIGFKPAFPNDPDVHTYPVDDRWNHVVGLIHHYASQFDDDWRVKVAAAPASARTISLQLASTFPKEPS